MGSSTAKSGEQGLDTRTQIRTETGTERGRIEAASEMKDSDAVEFKEGCAAIRKEATEGVPSPRDLLAFPLPFPPSTGGSCVYLRVQ